MKNSIVLFVSTLVLLTSCAKQDDLTFEGYIPKNAMSKIEWKEMSDQKGNHELVGEVTIILNTGEKFKAKFSGHEIWPGSTMVIYKNSYPLVKNQEVKVSGTYRDDDNFWIEEAEL